MQGETPYEDGTYLDNNPTWHQEDSPWKAAHIVRLLRDNQVQAQRVAEVGCGAGEVLRQVCTQLGPATRGFGYEISPQAFALCSAKASEQLAFRQENVLADASARFDVLMAIDVFEHVEDCFAFLRAARERAAWKVYHIPLDLSAQAVLRGTPIMAAREQVGHLHYFTKDTALATLKDTGHEIVDWFYTQGAMELAPTDWKTRLMRWPRRLLFALNRDLAARALGGYSLMVLAR